MGVPWGTPSHHPFLDGIFHEINQPFWVPPWPWKPHMPPWTPRASWGHCRLGHLTAGPNDGHFGARLHVLADERLQCVGLLIELFSLLCSHPIRARKISGMYNTCYYISYIMKYNIVYLYIYIHYVSLCNMYISNCSWHKINSIGTYHNCMDVKVWTCPLCRRLGHSSLAMLEGISPLNSRTKDIPVSTSINHLYDSPVCHV